MVENGSEKSGDDKKNTEHKTHTKNRFMAFPSWFGCERDIKMFLFCSIVKRNGK